MEKRNDVPTSKQFSHFTLLTLCFHPIIKTQFFVCVCVVDVVVVVIVVPKWILNWIPSDQAPTICNKSGRLLLLIECAQAHSKQLKAKKERKELLLWTQKQIEKKWKFSPQFWRFRNYSHATDGTKACIHTYTYVVATSLPSPSTFYTHISSLSSKWSDKTQQQSRHKTRE